MSAGTGPADRDCAMQVRMVERWRMQLTLSHGRAALNHRAALGVTYLAVFATIGKWMEMAVDIPPPGRASGSPCKRTPSQASPQSSRLDGSDSQAAWASWPRHLRTPCSWTLDCITRSAQVRTTANHHQWERCEERLPANRQTPAGTGHADRLGAMQAT